MKSKLFKKTLSLVMCLAMLLTILPVSSMTAFAATDVPASQAFALKNSDFLNGTAYWNTYIAPWEYGAYNIDASFATDDDGMKVDIRSTGDFHTWDSAGVETVTYPEWLLDVDQSTTMYAGVNYTAAFTLTSSITRNVHFTIEGVADGYIYWESDCALVAGQKKTVEYQIPATQTNYDVVVRIQLGHNELDAGTGYDVHTVRVHKATLEAPGARDEYLMVYDTGVSTGAAQYNVNVVAGQSYKVQFAARADSSAVAAVTLGGQNVVSGIELDNYTQELAYSFTSPVSGNVALRIANVAGGTTRFTNVSFSTVETEAAMGGICFPTPSIRLNGATLTAVSSKVAYGKDVSFTVNCSDLNAWSAAAKTVLINGEKVDAAVTMSGNTATVSASAFTGEGRYKVAIRANGFETSEGAFVTILPSNGNLLQNSDFDAGFASWDTLFLNGSATGTIVDNRLKIDVIWWDEWSWDNNPPYTKVDWQIMLNQANVSIEAGKTYTLTFNASSTVNRPILVQFKDKGNGQKVNLTGNNQTYTLTFASTGTENIELQFLFGYMDGVPENPEHTMYISDIVFAEQGAGGVTYPTILGVTNGAVYKQAVTPSVKNASNYNVTLYKLVNGTYVRQNYNLGDTISTDGEYKITAVDKSNSALTSSKLFTVATAVDYSKTYYMVKNRSNSYVMKSYGVGSGAAVVQSLYNKELSQFWTLEDVGGGYYVIRNAASEKVLAIENANANSGGKIVQEDYFGDAYQQWRLSYESQGYYSVINRASGLAIDSPWGGADGTQLQSYTSNSTNAQQWDFVEVDLTSIVKPPVDVSTVDAWKKNAIINPLAGKLNPAGPIFVTWYAIADAVSYDVYVDGAYQGSVSANGSETYEYEWYSVDVSLHNCYVVAVMGSGSKISTDTCSFYVTKKGIGWGTLYRTEDMNLSWYYHWAMDPAAGTDEDLQFVPMLWGNWDSGNQWLQNPENKKYKTVLGFNEPDWTDQSNVSVEAAIAAWPYFCESGLRVGSPATAIAPPYSDGSVMLDEGVPDTWFPDFMNAIDADPDLFVDFIAIHCYDQGCDAEGFLKMVDDTWEMYHLPIWITEFGVARWDQAMWDGSEEQDKKVIEFMRTVLTGLEERDYVERYAWFPFDPNDAYGGSSGLFDYDTGELTELGELYKSFGLPEGYGDPITPPTQPTIPTTESTTEITVPTTEPTTAPSTEPSTAPTTEPTTEHDPNANLALGKAAFSSDEAISPASLAVDGNGGSRWESKQGVDPQWMYVDLGASYNVNKVVINWETAAAKAYQVQVSGDANNWKTVYSTTEGDAGVDTIEFAAENARYVRIYGTERTTGYGYSIWELEVYAGGTAAPTAPSTTPSTAPSTAPSTEPSTTPSTEPTTPPTGNLALGKAAFASTGFGEQAVDGNTGSRWESSHGVDPSWMYVDLGASYSVNKVVINWETAAAKAYQVQVSGDANNWKTVYSTTEGDAGVDTIEFAAENARYVRIYGTERTTGYGYSIWELEVYGGTAAPTAPSTTPSTAPTTEKTTEPTTPPTVPTGNPAFSYPEGNAALGKDAEASTGNAAQAVDGNTGSRWESQHGVDPSWMYVDLGENYMINRVVINWETAAAKVYKVQVSDDAQNWTDVKTITDGDAGIDEITFDEIIARYVRIYGTERTTGYGYSIWELEVYYDGEPGNNGGNETVGTDNLALGKSGAVSSAEMGDADDVTDGNTGSRWSSEWSDNQWVYVDLGSVRRVGKVVLNWEGAYGKAYQIQVSTDAQNWTTVKTVDDGNGGIDELEFDMTDARYVRMYGTQRGTGYGFSLWEMEVYGA